MTFFKAFTSLHMMSNALQAKSCFELGKTFPELEQKIRRETQFFRRHAAEALAVSDICAHHGLKINDIEQLKVGYAIRRNQKLRLRHSSVGFGHVCVAGRQKRKMRRHRAPPTGSKSCPGPKRHCQKIQTNLRFFRQPVFHESERKRIIWHLASSKTFLTCSTNSAVLLTTTHCKSWCDWRQKSKLTII